MSAPTVSQIGLSTAIIACVAVIYHTTASQPAIGYRAIEITHDASDERFTLLDLQPGERALSIRHTVLTNHGDCFTLRWVCEPTPQADDYRPHASGTRSLIAPACTTRVSQLAPGDVRVWHVTLTSSNHSWGEAIYDQPGGSHGRNERELPICTYGGMPEGL